MMLIYHLTLLYLEVEVPDIVNMYVSIQNMIIINYYILSVLAFNVPIILAHIYTHIG